MNSLDPKIQHLLDWLCKNTLNSSKKLTFIKPNGRFETLTIYQLFHLYNETSSFDEQKSNKTLDEYYHLIESEQDFETIIKIKLPLTSDSFGILTCFNSYTKEVSTHRYHSDLDNKNISDYSKITEEEYNTILVKFKLNS